LLVRKSGESLKAHKKIGGKNKEIKRVSIYKRFYALLDVSSSGWRVEDGVSRKKKVDEKK